MPAILAALDRLFARSEPDRRDLRHLSGPRQLIRRDRADSTNLSGPRQLIRLEPPESPQQPPPGRPGTAVGSQFAVIVQVVPFQIGR